MIHSLALTVVLAFQGGPAHADLHPAGADVYLELGNVNALLPALERAPLVQFLRDESLAPLFEQLGQAPSQPLKDQIQGLLAQAWPESNAPAWFPGLGSVSVSITAVGPETDERASIAMQAVADLATAEQAEALRAALVAEAPAHEPYPGGPEGTLLLKMGETPADHLWCAVAGTRLVLGGTGTAPADFTARAEKAGGGLASQERFQRQLAALEEPSGTPVLWFALARSISEIATTAQGEDVEDPGFDFLAKIPGDLNPLGSARVARTQLVGERYVTEMISAPVPGESTGRPVDAAWLEPVPPGSMIVYASAFDGAAAGKRMRELLATDEQSTAALAAIEQKLGFGPERVLARLGPGLTAYSAPLAGLGLPDMRVWIDCADPAAFTADFEALVGALGETLPGFTAKTRPYKLKVPGSDTRLEVPVTTLTLPQGLVQIPMISLTPSFAPVGERLVFGLNSMDVKNELKRVHSGEGEPIVAGAKPLDALGFGVPEGALSVFVMDWGKLLGSAVTTFQGIAQMAGPEAFPFDLKMLPSAELFTKHFKPTFHYSKQVPAGVYRRNEASFGPEAWFGLFAGAAAAGMSQQGTVTGGEMDGGEPATIIEVPLEDGEDGR
jgi:hypothetical protein